MSKRNLLIADVIERYNATAGVDPDDVIEWGLGPVTDADVSSATTNATIAGDLKTATEPWTSAEADVIRDYLVGIARGRRPRYRLEALDEVTGSGELRERWALVHDEDGVADNWAQAIAEFRRYTKLAGPTIPSIPGLGPVKRSRQAARIGISKRELQRRRRGPVR